MTSLVQKRAPQWKAKAVVQGRIEDLDSKAYEGTRADYKIRALSSVWLAKLTALLICFHCREVPCSDVLSLRLVSEHEVYLAMCVN